MPWHSTMESCSAAGDADRLVPDGTTPLVRIHSRFFAAESEDSLQVPPDSRTATRLHSGAQHAMVFDSTSSLHVSQHRIALPPL